MAEDRRTFEMWIKLIWYFQTFVIAAPKMYCRRSKGHIIISKDIIFPMEKTNTNIYETISYIIVKKFEKYVIRKAWKMLFKYTKKRTQK